MFVISCRPDYDIIKNNENRVEFLRNNSKIDVPVR